MGEVGLLTDAGTAPLIAAVIFAVLAYFIPADHRYETVDLEWVSTRPAFDYPFS